jgi:hypothetical protein
MVVDVSLEGLDGISRFAGYSRLNKINHFGIKAHSPGQAPANSKPGSDGCR